MKLIVGLGNPGKKYKNTRHNVGFMVLDKIAEQNNLSWEENKKFKSLFSKNADTLYIKPQTYMNNSGLAVQALMSYYKLIPKKLGLLTAKNSDLSQVLTVIHDDIDIELGKYKIADNSGSAGHKGVTSIIQYLKTKNFKRYRIGIQGNKPEQMPTEKYVLENFKTEEFDIINKIISKLGINAH